MLHPESESGESGDDRSGNMYFEGLAVNGPIVVSADGSVVSTNE